MGLPTPLQIDEITAPWATSVLGPRFPGTVVTSLAVGSVIHGTATKVRLLLDYNAAGHSHGLPPTLWFKGGLEAHSQTPDMLLVYANEAEFFAKVAPTLSLNLPCAYAAGVEPGTNRSFVLLEDLLGRNAAFGHVSRPITPGECSLYLRELALLHGRYWETRGELAAFPWLAGGGSLLQSCDIMMSAATWERSMGLPRGEFVRGPLRDFHLMRGAILRVLTSDVENANCLVHGDSHMGNTFQSADGAVGFIDWQSHFHGMWAHDVAYFLITALTIDDRRAFQEDLLGEYVGLLTDQGANLAWDTAWLEYRKHALYSCAWSMCLPEWQTEETCCLVTERAIAATQDLHTLDAW